MDRTGVCCDRNGGRRLLGGCSVADHENVGGDGTHGRLQHQGFSHGEVSVDTPSVDTDVRFISLNVLEIQ